MRVPRGLWFTFAAFCVVVGLVTVGYVARAELNRPPVDAPQPAAVEELPPLSPGMAYVIPDAGPSAPPVPPAGSGRFATAGGGSGVVGSGRVYRYVVVVEDGSGIAADEFAATVERTLADPRGWTASRRWGFQRVSAGRSDLTVHLATPATTDRLCDRAGVETGGEVSCRPAGRTRPGDAAPDIRPGRVRAQCVAVPRPAVVRDRPGDAVAPDS